MASLPEFDTHNPDYIRWIKAGLVLRQLKDGLEGFLDREMRQVHADILTSVRSQLPANASLECTACTTKQLQNPRHKCPNSVCSLLMKELRGLHQFCDPKLKNVDRMLWCDLNGYWEMSKCFLPDGSASIKTPADTDCTGLLSLVINCCALHPKIKENLLRQPNIFSQVRSIRNDVMHSPTLCLASSDLPHLVSCTLTILNDSKSLKHDQAAQAAATNVIQIEKGALEISFKDQLMVLNELKQEMQSTLVLDELRVDLKERQEVQREEIGKLNAREEQMGEDILKNQQGLAEQRCEMEKTTRATSSQIELLTSAIQSVMAEAETLRREVKSIKASVEGLAVCSSALDARVLSLEGQRQEQELLHPAELDLKEDLLKKYRDLLAIIKVSRWNKSLKIEDIFTPIVIREDLEKQMAKASPHQMTLHMETQSIDPKTITSYDEVFMRDNVPQSDIYVIGKAGIGKSLFTMQLVHLWCKVQTVEPSNPIERLLKGFDYVFYVSCRYAKKPEEFDDWESLQDLILKQAFVGNKRSERTAKQILESGIRKCLILVDGLDEWAASASETSSPFSRPGIPSREGLYNCVFLTTSRPWRIEALPHGVGSSCRMLEIVGLDQGGVKQLAKNLLQALNEPDPDESVEVFLDQVREINMEGMVRVPLMLTNVVLSWHDSGHKLEKSMCSNWSGMVESLIQRARGTPGLKLTECNSSPTTEEAIPPCFANRPMCRRYWPLILKLSRLAFDSLLGQEKEHSLIFSKQYLVKRLGETDLETSLKLGILSQAEAISDTVECMVTVSFLHKSVQEFLAALWMCGEEFERCLQILVVRCKTLADVFDLQLVVLFVSGISPEKGSQLCKHVAVLAEKDDTVRRHRKYADYENDLSRHYSPVSVVVQVEELIVSCAREAACHPHFTLPCTANTGERHDQNLIKSRQSILDLFVVTDIFVDNEVTPESLDFLFGQADKNPSSIKSLVFANDIKTPPHLIDAVEKLSQLERLSITASRTQADNFLQRFSELVLRLFTLKSFGLILVCDFPHRIPQSLIQPIVGTLNSCPTGSSLFLAGIDMSSSSAQSTLVRPLFPKTFSALISLDFRSVTLSHQQIKDLCDCLKASSNLERLVLWKLRCDSCDTGSCCYDLDLSGLRKLQRLFVAFLEVAHILLGSSNLQELMIANLSNPKVEETLLSGLSDMPKLWRLEVVRLQSPAEVSAVVAALNSMSELEEIYLAKIDFDEHLLEIAHMTDLREIYLCEVIMSPLAWRRFIQTIPRHGLEVILDNCNVDKETKADLRSQSRCKITRWSNKCIQFYTRQGESLQVRKLGTCLPKERWFSSPPTT